MRRTLIAATATATAAVSFALVSCAAEPPAPSTTAVVAVRVTPANPTVTEGDEISFVAQAIFESGEARDVSEDGAQWSSSDPSVLEVNADGSAEAVAEGEAFVTATYRDITSPPQRVIVNQLPTSPTATPTPTPAPTADHVVISEVMYDATTEPGGEYVELHNPTGAPVVLDGWTLHRASTATGTYTFPAATTIGAGAYLVVANSPATYNTLYGQTTTYDSALSLTNGADWLVLEDDAMAVIDEVAWEIPSSGVGGPAGWCPTAGQPTAGDGQSISREPDGSDGDNCNDWVSATAPTPNAAN